MTLLADTRFVMSKNLELIKFLFFGITFSLPSHPWGNFWLTEETICCDWSWQKIVVLVQSADGGSLFILLWCP
jgi:hypothetical protein